MTKHDYIHMFKSISKHINEARKLSNNSALDDHLQKAKDALWVVADDMGIELLNGG